MTNSGSKPRTAKNEEKIWKFAGMVADIPENALVEKVVAGITVILLRHSDQIFAFPPSCPHMEEPLKNGLFDGDEGLITCTKHLWQWDAKTGAAVGLAECPLLKYELKVNDGRVLLNVSEELTYEFS
jgi:toluene monooxygenase system ferredoxin subunit